LVFRYVRWRCENKNGEKTIALGNERDLRRINNNWRRKR